MRRIAVVLLICAVGSIGFRCGKLAADRWYASHYCLIGFSDCGKLIHDASSSTVIIPAKGEIDGLPALVLRPGQHCVIYSEGQYHFRSACTMVGK